MNRWAVYAAGGVLLAANVWPLVAVRFNRGQPIGGTLQLTERELRLPRSFGESTVRFLELEWNTLHLPSGGRGMAEWLDADKLAELGLSPEPVRASAESTDTAPRKSAIPVFLVLEFEGETWRQAPPDRNRSTRLFVVDAGLDPQRLRTKYSDRRRYVITRGLVRRIVRQGRTPQEPLEARGTIETLLPSRIFVPLPYSRLFEPLPPDDSARKDPPAEPPLMATVSWGRNYEPWLVKMTH